MPRGRKPKFTLEQEQAIARRYETSDESMSAIAETLGVTRALIGQIIVRQGVKTRHHQHALTPSQEDEVVKRFTDGATGRDLQEVFGVDRKTITEIVRQRGGPLRRCGRKRVFESREAWLENPRIRIRKLLHTARACAPKRNLTFDNALIEILTVDPSKTCTCCGIVLDYTVYSRTEKARERSPSIDRCDNSVGYVPGNVHIVCFRCNRIKNEGSLAELKTIVAYMEKNLKGRV